MENALESHRPPRYPGYLSGILCGLLLQWEKSVKLRLGNSIRFCFLSFTCGCVWLCLHMCFHACGESRLVSGSVSIAFLHYILRRVYLWNPELEFMATLANQPALRMPVYAVRDWRIGDTPSTTWAFTTPNSRPHICMTGVLMLSPFPSLVTLGLQFFSVHPPYTHPSLNSCALYIHLLFFLTDLASSFFVKTTKDTGHLQMVCG